jgi:hypothetical protein
MSVEKEAPAASASQSEAQPTPVTERDAEDDGVQSSARMPYEHFLSERRAIVDARQRAQQRIDQLVASGAAGALVLSITFLNDIAPTPSPGTKPLLVGAWLALLISLALLFASHYASQRAFDNYLVAFDEAYVAGAVFSEQNLATRIVKILDRSSSWLFIIGVALLAGFAYLNLPFASGVENAPGVTGQKGSAAAATSGAAAATAPVTAPASARARRDTMAPTPTAAAPR